MQQTVERVSDTVSAVKSHASALASSFGAVSDSSSTSNSSSPSHNGDVAPLDDGPARLSETYVIHASVVSQNTGTLLFFKCKSLFFCSDFLFVKYLEVVFQRKF